MYGIIGTVPDLKFPLMHGIIRLHDGFLQIDEMRIPVNRGTPALIASAVKASEATGSDEIYAFLIGDTGRGEGSRELYKFLVQNITEFDFDVLTFHYIQPDVDWHNKVFLAVEKIKKRPLMIADAGFMYAAKMSGQAPSYDFFTPDIGELAFLADEEAPHPFYTRGFILHQNNNALDLIKRAYEYENAAKYLLVKGKKDYIVKDNKILSEVDTPSIEAMEAIGGTGDSLTGLLTVLSTNYELHDAATKAAKANRLAGYYAEVTPATQIIKLIEQIPRALSEAD
ncbi:MAG: sugar kinase [Spirochaetes bacterium]|nr:sugar kinase [Spirochaetota bacterium]